VAPLALTVRGPGQVARVVARRRQEACRGARTCSCRGCRARGPQRHAQGPVHDGRDEVEAGAQGPLAVWHWPAMPELTPSFPQAPPKPFVEPVKQAPPAPAEPPRPLGVGPMPAGLSMMEEMKWKQVRARRRLPCSLIARTGRQGAQGGRARGADPQKGRTAQARRPGAGRQAQRHAQARRGSRRDQRPCRPCRRSQARCHAGRGIGQ
jgi:hypothetical protein